MKITRKQLRRIIKEELARALTEDSAGDGELSDSEARDLEALVGDAITDARSDGGEVSEFTITDISVSDDPWRSEASRLRGGPEINDWNIEINDESVYVAGVRGNLSLEATANQVARGIADELGYDEDVEDRLSEYLRQDKDFSDTWESWRD